MLHTHVFIDTGFSLLRHWYCIVYFHWFHARLLAIITDIDYWYCYFHMPLFTPLPLRSILIRHWYYAIAITHQLPLLIRFALPPPAPHYSALRYDLPLTILRYCRHCHYYLIFIHYTPPLFDYFDFHTPWCHTLYCRFIAIAITQMIRLHSHYYSLLPLLTMPLLIADIASHYYTILLKAISWCFATLAITPFMMLLRFRFSCLFAAKITPIWRHWHYRRRCIDYCHTHTLYYYFIFITTHTGFSLSLRYLILLRPLRHWPLFLLPHT